MTLLRQTPRRLTQRRQTQHPQTQRRQTQRPLLRRALAIAAVATLSAGLSACATTEPQKPPPERTLARATPTQPAEPSIDKAALEASARVFAEAKARRDFAALWPLTATVYRNVLRSVGRLPAEGKDEVARAQGFPSSDAVRALSDDAWFVANRTHLAKEGRYGYAEGATVERVTAGAPITLPFDGKRVIAYRVLVRLSDGNSDVLGAIREGEDWRFIER